MRLRSVTRRNFIKSTAAIAASVPSVASAKPDHPQVRVAAIQMQARLGDVEHNLQTAANWIRKAVDKKAQWIVLPEFFTSGLSFHPKILRAHRPVNGTPAQMLKSLAMEHGVNIAGSFLAESKGHVYNTFVLGTPNGELHTHDKDFPSTSGESFCYAGGEDDEYLKLLRPKKLNETPIPKRQGNKVDGVVPLQDITIGMALCWENIRYRTARRLLNGHVEMLLSASGWPALPFDVGGLNPEETKRRKELFSRWVDMIRETPVWMASLLGVPVVHANLVGDMEAMSFPSQQSKHVLRFLGESRIVDADGKILASRSGSEGEGLVIHDVTPGRRKPSMAIDEEAFWIPENPPDWIAKGWYDRSGRDYYLAKSVPIRRGESPADNN